MNRIARAEAFLKAKLAENPDASIHPERMAYRLEHSMRVANIGREIARAEGLAEEALVIACLLHDVSYGEPWEGEQAWKEHGRRAAAIARPFLETLGLPAPLIEEMCYGIAIHVDDEAGFAGVRTPLAVSVGDADNIDRFDAYRIYETLESMRFSERSLEEKRQYVRRVEEKLERLADMPFATETATRLWADRISFQRAFYRRLGEQLRSSCSASSSGTNGGIG